MILTALAETLGEACCASAGMSGTYEGRSSSVIIERANQKVPARADRLRSPILCAGAALPPRPFALSAASAADLGELAALLHLRSTPEVPESGGWPDVEQALVQARLGVT